MNQRFYYLANVILLAAGSYMLGAAGKIPPGHTRNIIAGLGTTLDFFSLFYLTRDKSER